jgi:DNA-binding transcriptional LysR family regulator
MDPENWSRIELRHLIALQAVAREGSFAGAADSLGYTQSAISQQIAALERTLGTRLVERPGGRRRVCPTEAGETLIRHADAIIARLHAASADLAALAGGQAGRLTVGTYQSVGARVLPPIIREFTRAWPKVKLQIRESPDDQHLFGLLERAEIDLSFALLPPPEGPFQSLELLRDPYTLLVASGSPLADRVEPLTIEQIGKLPLVGFTECRQERWVEAQLRAHGAQPEWVFRSDDNATIQGMAAADVGVALVPRLTIDPADPRTVAVELGDLFAPRRLGVVWNANRAHSASAETFIALARDACRVYENAIATPARR